MKCAAKLFLGLLLGIVCGVFAVILYSALGGVS